MRGRILLSAIFCFLLPISTCDASSVSRAFSKTTANPSETISANLTVTITDARDDYYAIDETYPSGWAVVNPGGGDTSQPNHLKWAVTTGAANIVYTYTITAPSNPGTYTFSGLYEFNTTYSLPTSPSISGQTQVTVSLQGDVTGDSCINIQDMSTVALDFGKTSGFSNPNSDINGDGEVNIFDMVYIGKNFGSGTGC